MKLNLSMSEKDKENNTPNKDVTNLSFAELINISKWTYKFIRQISPVALHTYMGMRLTEGIYFILDTYLFSKILDGMIELLQKDDASLSLVFPYILVFAALQVIQTVTRFFRRYAYATLDYKYSFESDRKLYFQLKKLGIQTLENPEVNNKISRARDGLNTTMRYIDTMVEVLTNTVSLVGSLIIILAKYPVITLALVIFTLLRGALDKKYKRKIYQFLYEITEERRKETAPSHDLSSSKMLHEILISNSFSFFDAKYTKFIHWYIGKRLKQSKEMMMLNHGFGLASGLIIEIFGYLTLFSELLKKQITVGNIFFYIRMLREVNNSLGNVISYTTDLFELGIRIRDTYILFTLTPNIANGENSIPKLKEGPEILFRNVSFAYQNSNKDVIKNLSLHIRKGEKVAIVGHNGAGKTTLIKLLCRFYQTTQGEILINHENINTIEIESLYKNLGVLFQDFNIYPYLTVKENIVVGEPDTEIDEIAVRLAAQNADALEFIEEYPKKFDQILSEKFTGGIRPSSGQWQKLAIARFFYRNAPLVIFDEPTAAIDAVSEFNIFNKIYEFFKGKTVIIISHRFSTVRNADRIIVIDHGEIVEEGTHTELLAKNGKYAEAFYLQAQGYKTD